MASVRSFLVRGLLAGLLAGVVAFGVAYVVGEPSIEAAIAIEESAGHTHEAGPAEGAGTEVPRSLQSTLGLLTATAVAGTTLGGLVGVLSALALGRFGSLGVRGSTLLIAAIGFVSLYAVPFLAYPPNPPAVGQAETIGTRTALYFAMVAISVVAAVTAVLVGRRLASRVGSWSAALAGVGGYLLVCGAAIGSAAPVRRGADGLPGDGALRLPHRQLRNPARLVGSPRGRSGRAGAPAGAPLRPRREGRPAVSGRDRPDVIKSPSADRPRRRPPAPRRAGQTSSARWAGSRTWRPGCPPARAVPAAAAGPGPGGDPGR